MAADLFAGILVKSYAAARPWYERLFGSPPTFDAHETESVWQIAEHAWVFIDEQPEHAGHSQLTLLVDDFDARAVALAGRGLEPGKRETYENGMRKFIYVDPDGNEIGFGPRLAE